MTNVRTLVVAALAVIVIGVVGGVLTWVIAGPGSDVPEEWTVDAGPVRRIEIDAANADVDVYPTSGSQIRVVVTGRRGVGRADVGVEGDVLRIRVPNRRIIGFLRGYLHLSVALPARAYEALAADLANGEVSVDDLEIGDVRVQVDNGRIRLDAVRTRSADLQTRNGTIDLTNVQGPVTARTRNGLIDAAADAVVHPMDLETGNGNIRLEFGTAPTNATLELNTVNGIVTVFGTRRGTSWHQVLGSGDPLIRLSVRNGNITVTD